MTPFNTAKAEIKFDFFGLKITPDQAAALAEQFCHKDILPGTRIYPYEHAHGGISQEWPADKPIPTPCWVGGTETEKNVSFPIYYAEDDWGSARRDEAFLCKDEETAKVIFAYLFHFKGKKRRFIETPF